nr:uncharacterized protein LOC109164944 [Ipomoea batatas]
MCVHGRFMLRIRIDSDFASVSVVLSLSLLAFHNEDVFCVALKQAFLASFFVGLHLHERAGRVRCLKPKRMQMSWRDGIILEDSGIYTMRHMETYLGQGVSSWECGIVKGDKNMLNDLHKKFMHDILVSNINTHKHSVIQRVLEYDRSLFGRAR